jgi:hypothetical protein
MKPAPFNSVVKLAFCLPVTPEVAMNDAAVADVVVFPLTEYPGCSPDRSSNLTNARFAAPPDGLRLAVSRTLKATRQEKNIPNGRRTTSQ